MYSLVEPKKQDSTTFINSASELKSANVTQSSLPKQQPEMWFNPSTNRWCSKSCRRYRELIRDQELIKRGLRPGPQKQNTKKRKHAEVEESSSREQPKEEKKEEKKEHPLCQDPSKRVQPGDANFKKVRDAYFAKFGL